MHKHISTLIDYDVDQMFSLSTKKTLEVLLENSSSVLLSGWFSFSHVTNTNFHVKTPFCILVVSFSQLFHFKPLGIRQLCSHMLIKIPLKHLCCYIANVWDLLQPTTTFLLHICFKIKFMHHTIFIVIIIKFFYCSIFILNAL